MSTSEATYRDWASLPNGILYTISSMLLCRDYLSFSKVCTSWRAARGAPSKMPYFLYFDISEQSKQPILSFGISKIENLSHSSLYCPYPHGKWRCVGSQDGWLIGTVEDHTVSLFNPLTAQQIKLPNYELVYPIRKAVIMWPCETGDELIVILFLEYNQEYPIAFARISGKKWYYRSKNNHSQYEDICCIDRKAFLLDCYGQVYAINLNKSSYHVVEIIFKYSSLGEKHHYMFTDEKFSCLVDARGHYRFMVKFGRDILCIEAYCDDNNFVGFAIDKYDMKKQTRASLKDLGGCSLFVGESCSILVSAKENIGHKGDVIYFQNWDGWMFNKVIISVFDMKDGSYKTIELSDRQPRFLQPAWFAPSTEYG